MKNGRNCQRVGVLFFLVCLAVSFGCASKKPMEPFGYTAQGTWSAEQYLQDVIDGNYAGRSIAELRIPAEVRGEPVSGEVGKSRAVKYKPVQEQITGIREGYRQGNLDDLVELNIRFANGAEVSFMNRSRWSSKVDLVEFEDAERKKIYDRDGDGTWDK